MDFLGLKTLSVLERARQLVKQKHGVDLDLEKLDITDPKVFELFADGRTKGIFQFESGGMQDLLMKMRPDRIEDLIAANALYRPGPMILIPDYIDRKHGAKWSLPHPIMTEVLEETYGIMCIHEDARIAMADGTEKPIRDVRIGDQVHSLNRETSQFEVKPCHGCGPTRRGDGVKITLENGFSVTLTDDHEVYTFAGRKEAGQLDPASDLVATAVQVGTANDDTAVGSNCDAAPGGAAPKPPAFFALRQQYEKGPRDPIAVAVSRLPSGENEPTASLASEQICAEARAIKQNSPAGTIDNSPPFQRWVLRPEIASSPVGAKESRRPAPGVLSSLTGLALLSCSCSPAMNRWAIGCRPSGWGGRADRCTEGTRTDASEMVCTAHPTRDASALVPCYWPKATNAGGSGAEPLRPTLDLPLKLGPPCARPISRAWDVLDSSGGYEPPRLRYYRITRIERVHDQQFYGMSVANHHNLVANGVVVKNCYQEQVMRICNRLGDIPLRDAYTLIKAISKKKVSIIQKEKERFLAGCVAKGLKKERGGADLRADRAVRRLWLQQEPLDAVCVHRVPDGLHEGPLARRVHGGPADLRNGRHGQDRRVHRRVPGDGHRGDGPGHQRKRRRFHAAVQGDRPRG